MARRVSARFALALSFLALLAPLAFAQRNIATLRVTSVDALLGDLQQIATALEIPLDRDQVIDGAMMPLQFSGAALLDRSRPAAMVFPARGMDLGAGALAAVLPVTDPEAALIVLEGRFETHGVNGSIHTFSRSDGPAAIVRVEQGYLVVGIDPTVVAELDLAAALAGGDLLPGNISLDIVVEDVAPVLVAGLMQGRQMLQMKMELDAAAAAGAGEEFEEEPGPGEEGAEEEPEEAGPDEAGAEGPQQAGPDEGGSEEGEVLVEPRIDPQALMPVLDLYFDFLRDAVANLSRVQISVEVSAEHLLLHKRVFPRSGSTLAGLIAAQSGGFPELARLLDPDGAFLATVGRVTRTPAFNAALSAYAARYMAAMRTLLASGPDGPLLDQYVKVMDGMLPLIEQALQCYSGTLAAVVGTDPEGGIRATQVMGAADADACRTLLAMTVELFGSLPAGEDGEPMFRVAENALTYAGVSANRQETRLLIPSAEGEEAEDAVEFTRTLFGGDRLVAYWGLADDILIGTVGAQAEQAFKDVVDRRTGAKVGGGLSPAMFAPLATEPGAFMMLDFGALFGTLAELDGMDEDAAELRQLAAGSGRVVFGARFSQGDLSFDVAMPLETLGTWSKAIRAQAEEAQAQEHEGKEEGSEDGPGQQPPTEPAVPEISD